MTENLSEQDHRIHSPELAHHMGYAEHPYRELAAISLKHGLSEEHENYLSKAHEAGMESGDRYVQSLQASLDGIKSFMSTQDSEKSKEPYDGVVVSNAEYRSIVGNRGWDMLQSYYEKSLDGTLNSVLSETLRMSSRKMMPLGRFDYDGEPRRYKYYEIDFASLSKFIDAYTAYKTDNPGVRQSEMFNVRNQMGDYAMDNVIKFVEHKRRLLADSENPEA